MRVRCRKLISLAITIPPILCLPFYSRTEHQDQTDKMFGRSNNVTFSTRKTTTLGKRLQLHRHLPHSSTSNGNGNGNGNFATTTTGCRSQTSKLCELRKSNSFSDNFTTRQHAHTHGNVAIATQVISPSAIGQSTWHHGSGGGRGPRLITTGFGRRVPDEDDDDDQNSLLIGRRRRWCTWSKLGCVATTIGASIIALTIIILAVGYMQSEKERVFSKPVRFVQRDRQREREGRTLIHQYRALLDEIEPWSSPSSVSSVLDSALNDTDTGQNQNNSPESEFSVTTYRPTPTPTPTRDDHEAGFVPLPTVTTTTRSAQSQDREAQAAEAAVAGKEILDFVNEIRISDDSTKEQKENNGNNGLHQLQPYHERELEHEQVIAGEQEQFEYSDSPPSEVKVLPPKDFVFNPNSNSMTIAVAVAEAVGPRPAEEMQKHNGGSSGNNGVATPVDIVQQLNNAHNSNANADNGFSFTIPIYTAANSGEGTGAADITRNMLDSFTSSTPTPSTSVSSTPKDELILVHLTHAIDSTTIAPAAASNSNSNTSEPSSSSIPGPPFAVADYANPFNYEPAPVQTLNTKVAHTNDVPVVAKLQTDLFDEDDDERGEREYENEVDLEHGNGNWPGRHGHERPRGPNSGLGVTVRGNNIHVHGNEPRSGANANGNPRNLHGHGYGYYGERVRPQAPRPPPRVRVHDRMYTPKPGSVVIIEPVEYPAQGEENRHQNGRPHEDRRHHHDQTYAHKQDEDGHGPRGHEGHDSEDDEHAHEEERPGPPTKVYTHTPAPPPQRPQPPQPQPRPRPTPAPERTESKFHPSSRPRTFPLKTTSTASSFSKLYEFHGENSNSNDGHGNDGRANINTKVEYIKIDNSAKPFVPSKPMSSSQEEFRHPNHDYSHSQAGAHSHAHATTTTSTTTEAPPVAHQHYTPHLTHFPIQPQSDAHSHSHLNSNAYYSPPDQNDYNSGGGAREIKNPLLSPEVNRFLSNLNNNANAQLNANAILAPIGVSVGISPAQTQHHQQHQSSNFGIATNSHLAELSNFDNFDFSQFLTKTPEPTAANNYGGATTPVTDASTDMHLTKRTYFLSGLDSSATTSASTNPYAYLFTGNGNGGGNGNENGGSANTGVLGSPTPSGAGLSLHPFNQNQYTHFMLDSNLGSGGAGADGSKLPSGSIPLDLASSYIPVFQPSVPIASATAYGAPAGTPSVSLINYNDPTLALASYYTNPGQGQSGQGGGGSAAGGGGGGGNYNTITQGIHLLSLLSGNIPQHLLQVQDQHASGSNVNEVRAQYKSVPGIAQGRSNSNETPSSSLLKSLVPDQLGSFSQNIVTKLNALKNQVLKAAALKSVKPSTNTMDILGIRSPASSGSGADAEEVHSTLVKKDGAKNYGEASASKELSTSKASAFDQGSAVATKNKLVAGLKSGFYT